MNDLTEAFRKGLATYSEQQECPYIATSPCADAWHVGRSMYPAGKNVRLVTKGRGDRVRLHWTDGSNALWRVDWQDMLKRGDIAFPRAICEKGQGERSGPSYEVMRRCPWTDGRVLFAKMEQKAANCALFRRNLDAWLQKGSTLALRELARPWGWYFDSLAAANAIDSLDAWRTTAVQS